MHSACLNVLLLLLLLLLLAGACPTLAGICSLLSACKSAAQQWSRTLSCPRHQAGHTTTVSSAAGATAYSIQQQQQLWAFTDATGSAALQWQQCSNR
jgi:hypothetical protein